MVHLFDLVALICPTPVSQVPPTNKQTVQIIHIFTIWVLIVFISTYFVGDIWNLYLDALRDSGHLSPTHQQANISTKCIFTIWFLIICKLSFWPTLLVISENLWLDALPDPGQSSSNHPQANISKWILKNSIYKSKPILTDEKVCW